MSTHTPGPWHFGDTAGPIGIAVDRSDCHGFRNHVWIAKNIATEADARLIAAAPDLLEALTYARDEIAMRVEEDGGDAYSVKKACRKIDEAIAKAEGRKVKP